MNFCRGPNLGPSTHLGVSQPVAEIPVPGYPVPSSDLESSCSHADTSQHTDTYV